LKTALSGFVRDAPRMEVYDADMKGYFDSIPHDKLMACLQMRIADRSVLKLIRMWLKAPVVEPPESKGGGKRRKGRDRPGQGRKTYPRKGCPQGGVVSPLLANLYLHWFDKVFHKPDGPAIWANARLVRYADDFVVLARHQSDKLSGWIEAKLECWMGLEINREKTQVVNLREVGKTLDFLGFTFRFDRSLYKNWKKRYLNVFVSEKSVAREREKLRELTASNSFLELRLIAHLKRRSQRPFRTPKGRTVHEHFKNLGLVNL